MNEPTCDCCGKIPDVDPVTNEYDLHQMCHVGGFSAPWWCSDCAEIPKFGSVPCPDEFLNADGSCRICG